MNGALDSVFIYENISLRCMIKGTYRESDSDSTGVSLLVLFRQLDQIFINQGISHCMAPYLVSGWTPVRWVSNDQQTCCPMGKTGSN